MTVVADGPHAFKVLVAPLSVDDGGGFIAEVPELPGCFSDGNTPEEALRNARDAIGCWMEAATEMGRHVPAPKGVAA